MFEGVFSHLRAYWSNEQLISQQFKLVDYCDRRIITIYNSAARLDC